MALIRQMSEDDYESILLINNENVPAVSIWTLQDMKDCLNKCIHKLVLEINGQVIGFCNTIPPKSDYKSLNYKYFDKNYENFVYLDRIALKPEYTSKGYGPQLYDAVQNQMPKDQMLCCEVNLEPPNPRSLKFHQRIGFKQIGQQENAPGYVVALLSRKLQDTQ